MPTECLRKLIKSFFYAFRGITICIKNERNFRIHIVITIYALIFAKFFELERTQYAILFLTIGSVIATEAINTSIEKVINLVSPGFHPLAEISKDVAAAAVLINAIVSIIVGIFLFWYPSKLIIILELLMSNPLYIIIFILSLIISICFIFNETKKDNM